MAKKSPNVASGRQMGQMIRYVPSDVKRVRGGKGRK